MCSLEARHKLVSSHFWRMLAPSLPLLLLLGACFGKQMDNFLFLLSLIVQKHSPLQVIKYNQAASRPPLPCFYWGLWYRLSQELSMMIILSLILWQIQVHSCPCSIEWAVRLIKDKLYVLSVTVPLSELLGDKMALGGSFAFVVTP